MFTSKIEYSHHPLLCLTKRVFMRPIWPASRGWPDWADKSNKKTPHCHNYANHHHFLTIPTVDATPCHFLHFQTLADLAEARPIWPSSQFPCLWTPCHVLSDIFELARLARSWLNWPKIDRIEPTLENNRFG